MFLNVFKMLRNGSLVCCFHLGNWANISAAFGLVFCLKSLFLSWIGIYYFKKEFTTLKKKRKMHISFNKLVLDYNLDRGRETLERLWWRSVYICYCIEI